MSNFRARVIHVARKLATLGPGRLYVSSFACWFRSRRSAALPRPAFGGRVALVAHLYYLDLADEILALMVDLPIGSDLIVTTPLQKMDAATAALASFPNVILKGAPNRGRDIAPFLGLLREGTLAPYDAVLKLHTKRSPHLRDGDIRRKLLFTALAGSRRRVSAVLRLFDDPATGLVGWGSAWRNGAEFWMANRRRVGDLAAAIRAPAPDRPAFFEGAMFWFRPAALKRLEALDLETAFEPEAGQLDGALHHAVERLFALAASAEGFTTLDLSGRLLLAPGALPDAKP